MGVRDERGKCDLVMGHGWREGERDRGHLSGTQ